MASNTEIKTALDRLVDVYEKRPQFAQNTASARGVVGEGLACTITDGSHTIVADLPDAMGGGDYGPTPGYYARAGIISCMAIGIKMYAVQAGYDFRRVCVDIETDFDDRAGFKMCDKTAAPLETRLTVAIDSDLDEAMVTAFVEDVLSRDTWFLALRDAQAVKTTVSMLEKA